MSQRIVAQYNLQALADRLGGELQGDPGGSIHRVVTDLDCVEDGVAFALLPDAGPEVTLSAALDRGARLVITTPAQDCERPPGVSRVVVDAVPEALSRLVQVMLAERRAGERFTTFAVVGVNGKTTVANLLAAVLSSRLEVLRIEDAGDIAGLTRGLLDLEERHSIGVFELPLAPEGRLQEMTRWLAPEARVVTNLGPAHLDIYGSLGNLAREVMRYLEQPGCQRVVIEHSLLHHRPDLAEGCQVKTIGTDFESAILIQSVLPLPGAVMVTLRMPNDSRVQFRVPLEGLHNAYNFALVMAATLELGLTPTDMAQGMRNFEPPWGHFTRHIMASGPGLIYDQKGFNIASMRSSLMHFKALAPPEHRVLVLGEMPGLNMARDVQHRRLGGAAACLQPKMLVCVGERAAEKIAEGAARAGMPAGRIRVGPASQAHVLSTGILHRAEFSDVLFLKGRDVDTLLEPLGATAL